MKKIKTTALVVGGLVAGLALAPVAASASNGHAWLLGRSNTETAATTVTNSKGTPLSLKARSGYAPLAVNSTKVVSRLNADLLDGVQASSMARTNARVGMIVDSGFSPAVCPSGTKITGGGGLDEGGLLYSGPGNDPVTGDFMPNSWQAIGVTGDTYSIAYCISLTGKPVPGGVNMAAVSQAASTGNYSALSTSEARGLARLLSKVRAR